MLLILMRNHIKVQGTNIHLQKHSYVHVLEVYGVQIKNKVVSFIVPS